MAIAVNDQIARVQTILMDVTGVRWPSAELVDWLNDGQREIVMLLPKAGAVRESFTVDETDSLQRIPVDGIQFLRVVRNIGGSAIREVDRDILDSQVPDWHEEVGDSILHYVDDRVDQVSFYIYPKAAGNIELVYSKVPTLAAEGGDISLPDVYANALLDYVLYRAYSKDAESVANKNLADTHHNRFIESLGMKNQAQDANQYRSGVERASPVEG